MVPEMPKSPSHRPQADEQSQQARQRWVVWVGMHLCGWRPPSPPQLTTGVNQLAIWLPLTIAIPCSQHTFAQTSGPIVARAVARAAPTRHLISAEALVTTGEAPMRRRGSVRIPNALGPPLQEPP